MFRFDPSDLQLGLKGYLREAEEEDFFDAVMIVLFKKVAGSNVEAAFPREAFEKLCSLAFDENLFRALTREVRTFFQEAGTDCAKKQALLVSSVSLVELYFEACAKAALHAPFGCWAFCKGEAADCTSMEASPKLAYSVEAFDLEARHGYSGFLWFKLASAAPETSLLELRVKTRAEQLVAVGVAEKKLFVRCGRQEVFVQIDSSENHLLAFCMSLQDSSCQFFLDGHPIFRCEKLLPGFSPVDSEVRVTLLGSFLGRLNSYYACYGCDAEASLAVHREVGVLGIQSVQQLSLLQQTLKGANPHKIISPVCESSLG